MRQGDTIVALSSGSLPSGVAVVRVSGPQTLELVGRHAPGQLKPRQMRLSDVIDAGGAALDRGLVCVFPAPRSFTGEDCAEFHVHGSSAVVKALLRTLTANEGVRLAEAGEFTRRAFENGKLDLTAVEGLGDLIGAETESQRKQALARASGLLAMQLERWREVLLDARAEIEALLDFSDEDDVPTSLSRDWRDALISLQNELASSAGAVEAGRLVREGFRVALAGPPNAGKSSLLNALTRSDAAIVTEEAGTTRDVREVTLDLDGHLVVLVDMAGLRETESLAEAEGVRRALREISDADLVLWLVAPNVEMPVRPDHDRIWDVHTKSDLGGVGSLALSARTGHGLGDLLDRLRAEVEKRTLGAEAVLVSRERDRVSLSAAAEAIGAALIAEEELELAAEQLRAASEHLGRLLGKIDTESVLDRLFSAFCIGK